MSIPLSLPFYCFYPFLCLCLHMPIYLFLFFPFSPSVPLGSIDQCIPLSPFPSLPMTNFPLFVFEICVLLLLKAKATFYPNHLFTFFRLLFLYSLFFLSFFTSSSIFHFVLLLFNKMCFSPFSLFLYSVPVSFSIVRLISLDEGRQIRRDLKLQKYEKKPFHSCYFFPNSFLSLFPSLHFPMLIFAFFSEAVFLASLQILQEWKGLELTPFFALYEKFWSQHHWITLKFEFMWRFCANRRRAMGIYVILLFCLVHLLCVLFIVLLREPSKEEGSHLSVFPFLRTCDLFQGWECFAFRPIIY